MKLLRSVKTDRKRNDIVRSNEMYTGTAVEVVWIHGEDETGQASEKDKWIRGYQERAENIE